MCLAINVSPVSINSRQSPLLLTLHLHTAKKRLILRGFPPSRQLQPVSLFFLVLPIMATHSLLAHSSMTKHDIKQGSTSIMMTSYMSKLKKKCYGSGTSIKRRTNQGLRRHYRARNWTFDGNHFLVSSKSSF